MHPKQRSYGTQCFWPVWPSVRPSVRYNFLSLQFINRFVNGKRVIEIKSWMGLMFTEIGKRKVATFVERGLHLCKNELIKAYRQNFSQKVVFTQPWNGEKIWFNISSLLNNLVDFQISFNSCCCWKTTSLPKPVLWWDDEERYTICKCILKWLEYVLKWKTYKSNKKN